MWCWQQEADASLRKARALKAQRRDEYQKAHSSTNRSQEEQSHVANKQLEKKRRLEEEALQKVDRGEDSRGKILWNYLLHFLKGRVSAAVHCSWISSHSLHFMFHSHLDTILWFHWFGQAEEAQDQYQSCVADAGVRRMDLANTKSTILTQIREMVFQCDLTLKAVSCQYMILAVSRHTS